MAQAFNIASKVLAAGAVFALVGDPTGTVSNVGNGISSTFSGIGDFVSNLG